jgi:hypothetical protein
MIAPAPGSKVATALLRIGIVICVLAIVPSRLTAICLCNSPKEIVLELCGLTAVAICAFSIPGVPLAWEDLSLIAFLLFSVISGAFAATDRWESLRAVGISVAGVSVFWSCRAMASRGHGQSLLNAAALAVVLGAISVLLDAFGAGFGLSEVRPGGIFGNRSDAAHFIALGVPVLILQCLEAKSARRERLALVSIAIAGCALLLTRSRAGWLAATAGALVPLLLSGAMPRRFHPSVTRIRAARAALGLVAGVLLGIFVPNQLQWSTAHPYAESLENIAQAESGSGHVRLVQYRNSLRMLADRETLGVGPGNWKILYTDPDSPNFIGPDANSKDLVEQPVWFVPNRVNSDWIGFAVERGIPALVALLAAFAILGVASFRAWRRADSTDDTGAQTRSATLLGLLAAILIVGAFDSVLQLAAPTYLVFLVLGALAPRQEPLFTVSLSGFKRWLALFCPLILAGVLVTFVMSEIYVTYLLTQSDSDSLATAYRLSVDQRWMFSEIAWKESAEAKRSGFYPACD